MPTFELVLILKQMSDSALKAALKRSAGYIHEVGGTLRKMENLGKRNLPFKMNVHGKAHKIGHFFVFSYDSGMEQPLIVHDKLKKDLDIVRASYWLRYRDPIELHSEKEKPECTLEVDLLPPPYRPNVIALQELANKKKKKTVQKNIEDTDFLVF